ncbi:MAG: RHS repeat-associated core domain-containing protein, partial [Planctomycetes bacterium]|nr:RHS repeat-associated core domain-containing protein [Planctomycetota bacterium]
MEYTYYDDVTSPSTDIGSAADLVLVKYSTLNSDGSTWSVSYIHYRYYRDADSDGDDHELKAVYRRDGVERILTAGDTAIDTTAELLSKDDSYAVNSGTTVAEYATRSFTYYDSNLNTDNSVTTPWGSENLKTKYGGLNQDETRFVKSETINAGCVSCGGGGSGAGSKKTYFYTKLSQGGSPPNDEVVYIVIEDTEDGNGGEIARRIYGLNDDGRMLRIAFIEDPTLSTIKAWCNSIVLDSDYRITERRSPSAHTVVDTDAEMKKFLDPKAATNDSDTLNASDGVIVLYTINADGNRTETKVKKGKNGTAYFNGA